MANNCALDMRIAGKTEAVIEMVQMLSRTGPFQKGGLVGLGRVFSFDLDEGLTERHPEDPSIINVQGFGDCAWSIKESLIDVSPYTLESECKRLGVVVEAFSSEPGNNLQEHYLCVQGEMRIEERVKYEEHVIENMSSAEIENLAKEKNMTVEELQAKVNDNGEYTEGGIANYCNFQDLFPYLEQEREVKFVLDDEILFCQDSAMECANFYLWATNSLVTALKEQEAKALSEENLEAMENISFFADYNLHTKKISLSGVYDVDDIHVEFDLPIKEEDVPVLIKAMESYCQTRCGSSCMEQINEFRKDAGKGALSQICALEDKLRNAEAIEYKGIIFDDWTIDQEYATVWGEMCQGCADKHMDLIKDELDDGDAIGVCSVKGCHVIGAETDNERHYYIDFKPELIKVIERKPSLDALCADAEARRNSNQMAQEQVSERETER